MGYWDSEGKWVNDPDNHAQGFTLPGDPDPTGTGKPAPHSLATIPNSGANMAEAKRLYNVADNWKPTGQAATAEAPTWNTAHEIAARNAERAQLARLAFASQGGGPSIATHADAGARDAVIKQQMAAGGGSALANRAVLGAGANLHGTNAINYGAGKAGEQQAAWRALTNAAFGSRGADIASAADQAMLAQKMGLVNAGNQQAVSLANMTAEQKAQMNALAAAQAYGGLAQDSWSADQGYRAFLADRDNRARKVRDESNRVEQEMAAGTIGTVAQVGVGAMMMSDEHAKKEIKPANDEYRELLDHAVGYRYRYKHPNAPGAGHGEFLGPMAQDLEGSHLGKSMVHEGPNGMKTVDGGRAGLTALAAASYLNDRLDSLEDRYAAAFGEHHR
jgi:hypothetical protein